MLTPTQVEKDYDLSEVFRGTRFIFFKMELEKRDKMARKKKGYSAGAVYRIVDGQIWLLSDDITQEMTNFIYERVGQKKQKVITKRWQGKEFTSLGDPYTVDYPEATDEMGHMWEMGDPNS